MMMLAMHYDSGWLMHSDLCGYSLAADGQVDNVDRRRYLPGILFQKLRYQRDRQYPDGRQRLRCRLFYVRSWSCLCLLAQTTGAISLGTLLVSRLLPEGANSQE